MKRHVRARFIISCKKTDGFWWKSELWSFSGLTIVLLHSTVSCILYHIWIFWLWARKIFWQAQSPQPEAPKHPFTGGIIKNTTSGFVHSLRMVPQIQQCMQFSQIFISNFTFVEQLWTQYRQYQSLQQPVRYICTCAYLTLRHTPDKILLKDMMVRGHQSLWFST